MRANAPAWGAGGRVRTRPASPPLRKRCQVRACLPTGDGGPRSPSRPAGASSAPPWQHERLAAFVREALELVGVDTPGAASSCIAQVLADESTARDEPPNVPIRVAERVGCVAER